MSRTYGKDYTGLKFGHLTVTSFFPTEEFDRGSWNCKCDCGNENIVVYGSDLRNETITSCNCTLKDYPYKHRIIKAGKYTFIYNDLVYENGRPDGEFYKKLLQKYKEKYNEF